MNRPAYPTHDTLPAAIAAQIVESSLRKAVWVNSDGEAFWLNDLAQAEAIAAKSGGTVFPPVA